jgi:chromosomal replication initiation ATPase DnaA
MTVYYEEPKTAEELLARYREVKRRLNPPVTRTPPREFTVGDAEGVIAFVVAASSILKRRTQDSAPRAEQSMKQASAICSRSKAQAAVWAVSRRTGVSVHDIFGRQRLQAIVSARHEAIWHVRQATDWSLPRVRRFFAGRDHTTVLHSLRWMERRASRDPALGAYMRRIERASAAERHAIAH